MAWRLTVDDSFPVAGRGYCSTGKVQADAKPEPGSCRINMPDGSVIVTEALAFEHFAVPIWWGAGTPIGVLTREAVPVGATLEG